MSRDDFRFSRVQGPDDEHKFRWAVWHGGIRLGVIAAPDDSRTDLWIIEGARGELAGPHRGTRGEVALKLAKNRVAGTTQQVRQRRGNGLSRDTEAVEAVAPTDNPRTALNRLTRHLDLELTREEVQYDHTVGGEAPTRTMYVLRLPGDLEWHDRNVWSLLSRLVGIARTRKKFKGFGMTEDEIRAVTGLTRLPHQGLSAWQEGELRRIVSIREG